MLAAVLALPAWAADEEGARKDLRVAESLVEWGDCDEAVPWLEQALDKDPDLCRAHYHLAVCLSEDPNLVGGRQVRGAVRNFERCAPDEWAADVAEVQALLPAPEPRQARGEDGMSERDEYGRSDRSERDEGRDQRSVARPDDREDRDDVRRSRGPGRGSRGQGRDYWDRGSSSRATEDRRDEEEREDREERAREDEERREREERAREERERREREERAREERERREREERAREERAAEEDELAEIVIEDGAEVDLEADRDEKPARDDRGSRGRASTLPDLDGDEEDDRPARRKDRRQRDPWEDEEEWKDPYLDE